MLGGVLLVGEGLGSKKTLGDGDGDGEEAMCGCWSGAVWGG
jgi:hypothetical protein